MELLFNEKLEFTTFGSTDLLKSVGIKCFHLNIRSILSKFEQLVDLITSYDLDIISVNESKLDPNQNDLELRIEGYSIFRCDIARGRGGVMLYIRDSLKPEPMSALNNMSKIQVFWTKITLPFQNVKILFSTMYRPPDSKWNILML